MFRLESKKYWSWTTRRTLLTPVLSNPEDIFHHKHTQDIFSFFKRLRKGLPRQGICPSSNVHFPILCIPPLLLNKYFSISSSSTCSIIHNWPVWATAEPSDGQTDESRLKLDKFWGEPPNSGGCTFAFKILRYFWTSLKRALERVLRILSQPTNKKSFHRLFKKVFIHRFHQTSRRTGKLFKFKLIWSLKMVLLVNTLCDGISGPFSTTQILNSQKGIGNRNFCTGKQNVDPGLKGCSSTSWSPRWRFNKIALEYEN